ncbi:unnamed protein product, partial [Polarella glacialis]
CEAQCEHLNMIELCNKYFGKACTLKRQPFFQTGAADVEVLETFCVPKDCDNGVDRDALVAWFSAIYVGRRDGWHKDYDEASLTCPDGAVTVILILVAVVVLVIAAIPLGIFLFRAPKARGRTLISQADMQATADAEFADDAASLRGTGMGGDTMNSGFMGGTR